MNWLSVLLAETPRVVQGVETIVGDKAAGKTKQQIAQDALVVTAAGASDVLTGSNAVYGQAAATVAGLLINQTVAIAQAKGTYQVWTAAATAAQQDAGVAAAVAALVQSIENPATPTP